MVLLCVGMVAVRVLFCPVVVNKRAHCWLAVCCVYGVEIVVDVCESAGISGCVSSRVVLGKGAG